MDLSELIQVNSLKFGLDPKLVACIILQESNCDPDAYRAEDGFYEKYLKNKSRSQLPGYIPNFPPTLLSEKRARSISWGVMQIMGETAREMGFSDRWLPRLAQSEINIEIGCKYLGHLFARAAKTNINAEAQLTWVLTKWNGSSSYPALIKERIKNEEWKRVLHG